jgi:hypothetical protein
MFPSQRVEHAAGRYRLDGATALAWRPVDALLASWHASRLATLAPVSDAMILILSYEGLLRDGDERGGSSA